MVQKNVALAATAVFAVGFSSVAATPLIEKKPRGLSDLYKKELLIRAFENELYTRSKPVKILTDLAKKTAKDFGQRKAEDYIKNKFKSKTQTQNDNHVSPEWQKVYKTASPPWDEHLVDAAANNPKRKPRQPPLKPRGIDENELFIRSFEDLYERDFADIEDFLRVRWLELEELD